MRLDALEEDYWQDLADTSLIGNGNLNMGVCFVFLPPLVPSVRSLAALLDGCGRWLVSDSHRIPSNGLPVCAKCVCKVYVQSVCAKCVCKLPHISSGLGCFSIATRVWPLEHRVVSASHVKPAQHRSASVLTGCTSTSAGKNVDSFDASQSQGVYSIVGVGDSAPPNGAQFALQFDPQSGRISEYQMTIKATAHKLCPGTYRLRAFVKYSPDYDGLQMALHCRFYYANGEAGPSAAPQGPASGGWPTGPDRWQRVETTITLPQDAESFYW